MVQLHSIRICPGAWRPHYPWEHILWISPPWGSDDYIWLDFPEAIFSDQGLFYLSHVNPQFPVVFPDLPPVRWEHTADGGMRYQRVLPNGVQFSGTVSTVTNQAIALSWRIHNGSSEALTSIKLQMCLFLRPYYFLSSYGLENKYLFSSHGWLDLNTAKRSQREDGLYRLGWRDGPKIAKLPVIACLSSRDGHAVAFSWKSDTYSLVSNPDHPCIHADPSLPDLPPGDEYELQGEIFFASEGLAEIESRYKGGEHYEC